MIHAFRSISNRWKYAGVNQVAKTLNGWQGEISKGRERYRAHGKAFPSSILRPLSFRCIWHAACHFERSSHRKELSNLGLEEFANKKLILIPNAAA